MLKKIYVTAGIVALTSTMTYAGGEYYIGAGAGLTAISTSNRHYSGLNPIFMWGYSNIVENSYLSGEIFGSLGSLTFLNSHSPSMRVNNSLGIALLPGYLVKSMYVIYGRIGWLYSHFPSVSQYRPAAQVGMGLQANLTSEWSVRGEYAYTGYFSTAALGAPKSNQVVMSMIYRFA